MKNFFPLLVLLLALPISAQDQKDASVIQRYDDGLCAQFSTEDGFRMSGFCAKEDALNKATSYFFVVGFTGKHLPKCDKFYIEAGQDKIYTYDWIPHATLDDSSFYYLTVDDELLGRIRDGQNIKINFLIGTMPQTYSFDKKSFRDVRFISLYESMWPDND